MADSPGNRDLTLSPDTYLYLQSEGKGGIITVHRGPTVVNQTGQDQPVRFDASQRRFHACNLETAVQQFPRASEGDYVVVENPAEDGSFPSEATQQSKPLKKGRRVVIPGPWSEALYPGQAASVVQGHRLRSNQYLIVTIYNEDEAKKNWENTVVKAQTETPSGEEDEETPATPQATAPEPSRGLPKPDSFGVGTRIVIKGTDVSFYIPCTGVEVQKDPDTGEYVREAVTLEQLEYCCLIDENGKKEYPRGPKVVFPRPTQVFDQDSKKRRKFRPLELNTINGIHLKVTADFEGPDIEKDTAQQRKFKEGEELFVTGKTLQIYYPREELAIIEYGQGNKKHYSTAVPKGEGRYVIERETGKIDLVKGPTMLLADPRHQIPVRRVLSEDECNLWYPNNEEALDYNLDLAAAMEESPSGRSGVVSEGDYRKRRAKQARSGGEELSASLQYLAASGGIEAATEAMRSYRPEPVGEAGSGPSGSIERGTKYTQPKTLTLNTKYDGVPKVEVWPGFAVLIVGSEGERKVVEGPEVVLLEYDEKLGHFYLSTGKPKTTDRTVKDVYLKVHQNQVGDIVDFESRDHVKGKIKVSMRVNFEGESQDDKLKWFSVDNYVKYLCDHVRSIIAGMAKRHPVAEIKADYVNLVRDAILGIKPTGTDPETSEPLSRPGCFFESNNMRVVEVEVLDMSLSDHTIGQMLDAAQTAVVQQNIEMEEAQRKMEAELEQARRDLTGTKEKERIAQEKLAAIHTTQQKKMELEKQAIAEQLQVQLAKLDSALQQTAEQAKQETANQAIEDLRSEAALARSKATDEQALAFQTKRQELQEKLMQLETECAKGRFEAAKDGLAEVLVALTRDEMATRLAEASGIDRFLSGDNLESSLAKLLSGFPMLQEFFQRGDAAVQKISSQNRLRQPATAE